MFYRFGQNNSGGYYKYDLDNGLTEAVYIEADSKELAIKKAEKIGIYFNGVEDGIDCECCGDRWDDFTDDFETLEKVKELISEGWKNIESIIYKDGRIEIFNKI